MARKTTTSTEIKTKWIKANYRTFQAHFRYDTDADIIEYMEQHKDGRGVTDILRAAMRDYMAKG